jgi:dTDP-4-amino-4,6-dideoxygalactose transaminase
MAEPIYVTRPVLPPLPEFVASLEQIWETRILSNRGPFHQRLEAELATVLEVEHLSLATNGMLALEGALAVAGLEGEVITTPYSFVATPHALVRSGLTPVFADIAPDSFNIDPRRVEEAISERTSAILAVHCYGNPCDHEALQATAERRGLTLIYDAAHAFGVRRAGRGIFELGDMSILSFHATKAFNTLEGGAVGFRTAVDKDAFDLWANFGIASEEAIPALGSNAKMNELVAAFGLLQLRDFERSREARRAVDRRYREALGDVRGIQVPPLIDGVESNFSYFPILVGDRFPLSRDGLYERLKSAGIFGRRYFYPLLSTLPTYRGLASADPANVPNATRAAAEVLCLPIYPELEPADQDRVIAAIRGNGV